MKEKKTVFLFALLGCAVLIAFALYAGIVGFLVDPYVKRTQGSLAAIISFYDTKREENTVLGIGSSQLREALDAYFVERLINGKYTVYNLGFTGDLPLRRITEFEKIEEVRPEAIILGITYFAVSNVSAIPEDHLALIPDRIRVPEDARHLFTKRELELIDMGALKRVIYKRKFVVPALMAQLGIATRNEFENSSNVRGNFKNPFFYSRNQTEKELLAKLEKEKEILKRYEADNKNNRNKDALLYFIEQLKMQKIAVIVINMPVHPYLEKTITRESKEAYAAFINSSIIPIVDTYYDLENAYDRSHFLDLTHLNTKGKNGFSIEAAYMLERLGDDAVQ